MKIAGKGRIIRCNWTILPGEFKFGDQTILIGFQVRNLGLNNSWTLNFEKRAVTQTVRDAARNSEVERKQPTKFQNTR